MTNAGLVSPAKEFDRLEEGSKRFRKLSSRLACASYLAAGAAVWRGMAPPFAGPAIFVLVPTIVVFTLWLCRSTPWNETLLVKSVRGFGAALFLTIMGAVINPFVLEFPPDDFAAPPQLTGFGCARWSLTAEAQSLLNHGEIDVSTPGKMMLAFGVWGGQASVFAVWTPISIFLAAIMLLVIHGGAVAAGTYGFAMVFKYMGGPAKHGK